MGGKGAQLCIQHIKAEENKKKKMNLHAVQSCLQHANLKTIHNSV